MDNDDSDDNYEHHDGLADRRFSDDNYEHHDNSDDSHHHHRHHHRACVWPGHDLSMDEYGWCRMCRNCRS